MRSVIYILAAAAFLWGACRLASDYLVTRRDRLAPRNPATGIMLGAEPLELGPIGSQGAVLFVHGFVGAGNNFADLPLQLAALGWRVKVMRLPGHGTSPRELETVSADDLLGSVRRELAALRQSYSYVVLIGHSMGGALCTLAAAADSVDRLVLCAPFFGVTCHWYYLLRPETWTRIFYPWFRWTYKGRLFIQVNRREAKSRIVTYAWVPLKGLLTLYELGQRAGDPRVLQKIKCPVLLVHSSGDAASSPDRAASAFELIGSSSKRALWLEKSNHHLFWDYDRRRVDEEIIRFLGTVPGKTDYAGFDFPARLLITG